jgi:molybdate transport system substrate-binding protein
MTSVRLLPAFVLALALPAPVLVACGDDSDGGTTLTVYAASSLKATFEQVAEEFEQANDGVEVELVFGGSSDLVSQIQDGAEGDVFASADETTMAELGDDERGRAAQVFATNTLQIATPPDNPAGVETLQDLAGSDVDLVLCAPEVPCGAAAEKVAEVAGLELEPVSEEQSVADVLGKVTSGQADAGLVYVTDVIAAGDEVAGIEFAESADAVNSYPITTLTGSEDADLAAAFVELVLGATVQGILADAGFGTP